MHFYGILCERNRLNIYRFIEKNKDEFGLNWLFRRLQIYPNAYYNFLKNRRSLYHEKKVMVERKIVEVYHERLGVPGYRMMRNLLIPLGHKRSSTTIYKYMSDLGLRSIVRKRKLKYCKGKANQVFANRLNQQFSAKEKNKIWCTDFTYLFLKDGTTRYNCTIIDLFDRSVIASLNGAHMTADLAIDTLKIALERHKPAKGIILHSDQGSQFTAKAFNDFCKKSFVRQSMSRAGCPYDNAPMERYYNTLKNEWINLFSYSSLKALDDAVDDFAYTWYNHVRPHSYNNGLTPSLARSA